jgi:hypothetical protein
MMMMKDTQAKARGAFERYTTMHTGDSLCIYEGRYSLSFSVAGFPDITTENMFCLAEEGLTYSHSHCNTPLCFSFFC